MNILLFSWRCSHSLIPLFCFLCSSSIITCAFSLKKKNESTLRKSFCQKKKLVSAQHFLSVWSSQRIELFCRIHALQVSLCSPSNDALESRLMFRESRDREKLSLVWRLIEGVHTVSVSCLASLFELTGQSLSVSPVSSVSFFVHSIQSTGNESEKRIRGKNTQRIIW